jgi:hypothetical protein
VKRSSGPTSYQLHQSQSSLGQHFAAETAESDVVEDQYLNRATPAPEEPQRSSPALAVRTVINLAGDGERSEEPEVPPLPEDRAGETWHGSVGRQATIISQTTRARSKEGLLNEYVADEPSSPEDEASPTDFEAPADDDPAASLMRARSIDYGKGHVRHISAGSARLLDIRRSTSTGDRSPIAARGTGPLQSEAEETPPE